MLCSAMQCHCESMHSYAFAYLFIALPLRNCFLPWLRHSSLCHAFAIHRLSKLRLCFTFRFSSMLCHCQRFLASPLRIRTLSCHPELCHSSTPLCYSFAILNNALAVLGHTLLYLCIATGCLTMPSLICADSSVQYRRCHSLTLPFHSNLFTLCLCISHRCPSLLCRC